MTKQCKQYVWHACVYLVVLASLATMVFMSPLLPFLYEGTPDAPDFDGEWHAFNIAGVLTASVSTLAFIGAAVTHSSQENKTKYVLFLSLFLSIIAWGWFVFGFVDFAELFDSEIGQDIGSLDVGETYTLDGETYEVLAKAGFSIDNVDGVQDGIHVDQLTGNIVDANDDTVLAKGTTYGSSGIDLEGDTIVAANITVNGSGELVRLDSEGVETKLLSAGSSFDADGFKIGISLEIPEAQAIQNQNDTIALACIGVNADGDLIDTTDGEILLKAGSAFDGEGIKFKVGDDKVLVLADGNFVDSDGNISQIDESGDTREIKTILKAGVEVNADRHLVIPVEETAAAADETTEPDASAATTERRLLGVPTDFQMFVTLLHQHS